MGGKLKNCPYCRKVYVDYGEGCCPVCKEKQEVERQKVRDFLDECRRCGESLGGLVFDLLSGSADDRAILSGYLED